MIKLEPGMNPRDYISRHRERGPKRHEYTYPELAKRLNVSLGTVQNHRPDTPERVARLVHRQQVRQVSSPLTDEEIERFLGVGKLPLWENRWPTFQLWWCGGCRSEVLLSKGLCLSCGGSYPAATFNPGMYFALRVGPDVMPYPHYVPYHQLVLSTDRTIHHADGNKWNNRMENLVVMGSEEHLVHHRYSADTVDASDG